MQRFVFAIGSSKLWSAHTPKSAKAAKGAHLICIRRLRSSQLVQPGQKNSVSQDGQ